MAWLGNRASGSFDLEKARKRTHVDTFKSFGEQQTFSSAWRILNR